MSFRPRSLKPLCGGSGVRHHHGEVIVVGLIVLHHFKKSCRMTRFEVGDDFGSRCKFAQAGVKSCMVLAAGPQVAGAQVAAAQVAAKSCREAIATYYRKTGSYVKLIPWEDDDTKHIRDIFTELTLEKSLME